MGSIPSSFVPDEATAASPATPSSFIEDTPSSFVPDAEASPATFHPFGSAAASFKPNIVNAAHSINYGLSMMEEFARSPVGKTLGAATIAAAGPLAGFGVAEVFADKAIGRDTAAHLPDVPTPKEQSITSLTTDPKTWGNFLGSVIGSAPGQMGPGIAAGILGGSIGGAPGSYLFSGATSFMQNGGEVYGKLLERGLTPQEAYPYAMGYGMVMAALDTPVPGAIGSMVAKKLRPVNPSAIAENVVKMALKDRAFAAAKSVAKGSAIEGLGEGTQEMLGSAAETHAMAAERDKAVPFWTVENMISWADAAVQGALMGAFGMGLAHAMPQHKTEVAATKSLADFQREASELEELERRQAIIEPSKDPLQIQDELLTVREQPTLSEEDEAARAQSVEEDAHKLLADEARSRGEIIPQDIDNDLIVPPPVPVSFEEIDAQAAQEYERAEREAIVEADKQADNKPLGPEVVLGVPELAERSEQGGQTAEAIQRPSAQAGQERVLEQAKPEAQVQPDTPVPLRPEPSLHEVISSRDTEYHATDLEGARGILESGQIGVPLEPQMYADGTPIPADQYQKMPPTEVSTSRIARVATKAEKAISFELDSRKMPPRRPFAETDYGKVDYKYYKIPQTADATWTSEEKAEYVRLLNKSWDKVYTQEADTAEEEQAYKRVKELEAIGTARLAEARQRLPMNIRFEFENRTTGQPIPTSAVRAVLIDRSALQQEGRTVSGWKVISPNGETNFFADQDFTDAADTAAVYAKSIPGATIEATGAFQADAEGRIAEIKQLVATKLPGVPVYVYENGREMHASRARRQMDLANATAEQVRARIKERMARRGPGWWQDQSGQIDYNVFGDLVKYAALKLKAGFDAMSELVANFGEDLKDIYSDVIRAAKARLKDSSLPEPHPATEQMLTQLEKAANEPVPETLRGDLDRFGKASRNLLHVLQWMWRNPHIKPLRNYVEHVQEMVAYAERWRSVANKTVVEMWRLSRAQRNRLGNALYEATLLSDKKRRVLTNDELAQIFTKHELKEKTVELYKRIRSNFRDALDEMERLMEIRIKKTFAENPDPVAMHDKLVALKEEFDKLHNRDFFPLSRFGNNVLVVRAKAPVVVKTALGRKSYAKDAVVVFETFERTVTGELARRKAEFERSFPKDKFDVYKTILPEGTEGFIGYPPSFYEAVRKNLGLSEEQDKALRELILHSSPAQSFIQHMNQRRGTLGFSRDMPRTYSQYFSRLANHLSRMAYRDTLDGDLKDLEHTVTPVGRRYGDSAIRQEMANSLRAHFEDVMHPRNYAQKLRAAAFIMYFSLAPKQAIVNLTQLSVFALPYFTQILRDSGTAIGLAEGIATKEMMKAAYTVGHLYRGKTSGLIGAAIGGLAGSPLGPVGSAIGANIGGALATKATKTGEFVLQGQDRLTDLEIRMLKKLEEAGVTNQGYATMLGSVNGGISTVSPVPLFNWLVETGTMQFRLSEEFNRLVTSLTAIRLAQQAGLDERATYLFAREAVWRTMFPQEAWARPKLLRGPLSAATIFMSFSQNAYFAMFQNPGRMRSWLLLGLLGGVLGPPLAEDALDIMSMAMTWLNKKFSKSGSLYVDLQKELHSFFQDMNMNPELWMHGLARNSFGLGSIHQLAEWGVPQVDFSQSVSMGRRVPFIRPAGKAMLGMSDPESFSYEMAQDALGVAGTMGNGALRYMFDKTPQSQLFWRSLLQFTRGASRGMEAQETTRLTDNRGKLIAKFDPDDPEQRADALALALGMNPSRLAQISEAKYAEFKASQFYQAYRREIIRSFTEAYKDPEKLQEAIATLKRYNEGVPAGLQITTASIKRAIDAEAEDQVRQDLGLPAENSLYMLQQDYEKAYGLKPQK